MSGTRRLIASKIELLADEPLVGPTIDDIVLSAPAVTRLGNNPAVITFGVLSSPIPAGTSLTPIPVLAVASDARYFDPLDTNVPYNSRLTPSVVSSRARLSSIFGLGLKGTITFEFFLSSTALLATPFEVTFGVHGTDNLGNTWDKLSVQSIYDAPAAIGRYVSVSLALCIPHNPLRTHLDFFVDCNNNSAVNFAANGALITFDVVQ
jgi:hypothetical protein